jgi:hypothetical protein
MINEIRDVTGTQPVSLQVAAQGDAMKDLCLHGHSLSQGHGSLPLGGPHADPEITEMIPEPLARMASPNPQPAVAMDGTAGVNTERAKGLEPSTSSLGS